MRCTVRADKLVHPNGATWITALVNEPVCERLTPKCFGAIGALHFSPFRLLELFQHPTPAESRLGLATGLDLDHPEQLAREHRMPAKVPGLDHPLGLALAGVHADRQPGRVPRLLPGTEREKRRVDLYRVHGISTSLLGS